MKRSIELVIVAAAVLFFGCAKPAPAQTIARTTVRQGLVPISTGEGRVFTPASSIAAPGSAGVAAHTDIEVFVPNSFQPSAVTPPFPGYGYNTPASIACRYRVQSGTHEAGCNPNNSALTNPVGGGGTIAIVDAYDDPWIADDLATFSNEFGLPMPPSFQVVYASGTEPAFDTKDDGGWELEESLDVEYSHAMAPNANIVLVEAASNNISDLMAAVTVAGNYVLCNAATCSSGGSGQGEVVMSWGTGEYLGENDYDTYFTTAGVVYFAAAGDSPGVSYPCSSINVVCVGGTTLSKYPPGTPSVALNNWQEGTWEYTGGGSSAYEPIQTYQNPIASTLTTLATSIGLSTSNRAVPDIAVNGNPNTGYWVFDSFQFALLGYVPPASDAPDAGGWWIVGGTSAANNIIAGITNLSGAANGFQSSSANELTKIYNGLGGSNFNDVVSGTGVCGPIEGYQALNGWDPCSGVGVPMGTSGL